MLFDIVICLTTVIPSVSSSYVTSAPKLSVINLRGSMVVEFVSSGAASSSIALLFTYAVLLPMASLMTTSLYLIVTACSASCHITSAPKASVITLTGTSVVPSTT